MRVLPVLPAVATDDVLAKAMLDRGMPRAIWDLIVYNGHRPAALNALLTWIPRTHNHAPGEECHCP